MKHLCGRLFQIIALISLYYPFSVGLTFYQKWFIKDFKFPLTVVCCHYIIKFVASVVIRSVLRWINGKERVTLSWPEFLLSAAPIGVAASVDIGLSNWAFEYITVSLYTMSKSTCIVFILIFAVLLSLERLQWSVLSVVVFISAGLFLFTYRSSQFDLTGFLLVELAAACAGLRWALSQYVMQRGRDKLDNPIDVMYHVQPWMILSILPLLFAFEGRRLSVSAKVFEFRSMAEPLQTLLLISIGGCMALCMEIAEYGLLVCTSSLTLNIIGVIKEVVTLLLAHFSSGDQMSLINLLGLVLCFCGILVHIWSKAQAAKTADSQKDDFVLVSLDDPLSRTSLLADSDNDDEDS